MDSNKGHGNGAGGENDRKRSTGNGHLEQRSKEEHRQAVSRQRVVAVEEVTAGDRGTGSSSPGSYKPPQSRPGAGAVTLEQNEMRRAHRVPILMWVEINGKVYRTKDWSLTGFGLLEFDEEIHSDDEVGVVCMLPMKDASLRISAKATCRGQRGEVTGFQFENLGQQKRRILRHYVELAIEGKLDQAEDMVSTASLPGIKTPIEQALTLSDEEDAELQREFHWKSLVMILVGVLIILGIAGTIYYNQVYRLQTVGLISGTVEQVTANSEGILGEVLVTEGAFVDQGEPLFNVEDPELNAELELIEAQLEQLAQRQERADAGEITLASADEMEEGVSLIGSLREVYNETRLEYENARALFGDRIITNKDLTIAKNHFLRARTNLLRELAAASVSSGPTMEQQEERIRSLEMQQAQLTARRKTILDRLEKRVVVAPVRGKVFNVAKFPGEYVRNSDVVLLMERDATPVVLIRVLSDEALKLKAGMPATIYMPSNKQNYEATVSAIGYAAVSADATTTMEASLNETLVRLDFKDRNMRAPLNSRVRVYIRTK